VPTLSDLSPRSVKTVQMVKAEGVTDGESEDGDCDEVIYARWGETGTGRG